MAKLRPIRSAVALLLACAINLPTFAGAHPQESLGYEIEDGAFIWPDEVYAANRWTTCRAAKFHRAQPEHVAQAVAPSLKYSGDELGHDQCDLEIQLGPYTMANLDHDGTRNSMFDHVVATMTALDGANAFAGATANSLYHVQYRAVTNFAGLFNGFTVNPNGANHRFGAVNGILVNVDATHWRANRHVLRSPQATFSMDIRKLVKFFTGAGGVAGPGRDPYPLLWAVSRRDINTGRDWLDDDSNKTETDQDLRDVKALLADQVVRGFMLTSAMYLGDIVHCRVAIVRANDRDGGCGKASHALFLRERSVPRIINNATDRNDVNGYVAYFHDVKAYVSAHAAFGNNDGARTARYLGFLERHLKRMLRSVALSISNDELPDLNKDAHTAANRQFVLDYVDYLFTDIGTAGIFTTDFTDADGHSDYSTIDRRGRVAVLEPLFANHNKYVFFEDRGMRADLLDPTVLAVAGDVQALHQRAAATNTFGPSAEVTRDMLLLLTNWLRGFHARVAADIPSQ